MWRLAGRTSDKNKGGLAAAFALMEL